MIRATAVAASFAVLAAVSSSAVQAQWSPPSYQADPAVYKLIFEDARFRIIVATWKPGQGDKPHAHLAPTVVYSLTNCILKLTSANGETRIVKNRAGHAMSVPFTTSHVAQNIGPSACRVLFVENK